MSTETFEAFLNKVKTDEALRNKVGQIDRSDDASAASALAAISAEAGSPCSSAEFLDLLQSRQELADEELESVAGGFDRPPASINGNLKSLWRDLGKLTGWWG